MRLALDDAELDRLAGLLADRVAERLGDMTTTGDWLTTAEAANHLRLPSLDALHRLTAAGAVPHVKQGGRCLFHRAELDAWLDDHYAGPARSVSTAFPSPQKAP